MLAIKEGMDDDVRAILERKAQQILDEQVAANQQLLPRARHPQATEQLSQLYRSILQQGNQRQQSHTGSTMQIGLDPSFSSALLSHPQPSSLPTSSLGASHHPSHGVLGPHAPPHHARGTPSAVQESSISALSTAAASLASSSLTGSLAGMGDARTRDITSDLLSRAPTTLHHQHARTTSLLSPAALLLIEQAAAQQRLRQQEQLALATAAASTPEALAGRRDIRNALSLGNQNLTTLGSLAQIIGLEGAKRLLSSNSSASLQNAADMSGSGRALARGLTAELIAAQNAKLFGTSDLQDSLSQATSARPPIIPPISSSLVEAMNRSDASSTGDRRNVPLVEADGSVPQKVKSTHDFGDNGPSKKKKKRRRRPRQPRSKKPKDMPKRPLSAYNIFFRDERAKILNSIPDRVAKGEGEIVFYDLADEKADHRVGDDGNQGDNMSSPGPKKPHGKIGFENLAKVIGSRWKDASDDTLEKYKGLAETDMRRYKAEMKVYHAKEEEKQKKALKEEEEKKKSSKGRGSTEDGEDDKYDSGDVKEEPDEHDDDYGDSEDDGETVETKDETVQSDDTSDTADSRTEDEHKVVIPQKKRRRLQTIDLTSGPYEKMGAIGETARSSVRRPSGDSKEAAEADVITSL